MNKRRLITVFIIFILIISSCSGRVKSKEVKNQVDKKQSFNTPKNIESYLGKTIDELTQTLGVEPEIDY